MCDDGDVPLGGGYSYSAFVENDVNESAAEFDSETGLYGWRVGIRSPSPGTAAPYDIFLHVLCADLGEPHQ